MAAKGWEKSDFQLVEELPADQQSLALCHGRVHAMVYTVGHPNESIAKAAGLCDAVIVEVSGPTIEGLVNDHPYYAHAVIPGGTYQGNPDDVSTFGVRATIVSSADVPADTIYSVVKAVFDNLDQFKKMHPSFGNLKPDGMVRDGLSAPIHEGAARYFKERGLL
jgi:TRAP transporter TAXI family solute receptor